MRAEVITAPHQVEARSVDLELPKGTVPVEMVYVGLCGTDLHYFEGTHPAAVYPRILGHELLGVARAGRYEGRLVAVDPLVNCGHCIACRLGHEHVCANLQVTGVHRDGGLVEVLGVAEHRLHPVPEGLDPEVAALTEPVSVAVHSVRRAGTVDGAGVVVLGGGPIGVLIAFVARAAGAARVVVLERAPARRVFAASVGLELLDHEAPEEHVARLTNRAGADIVFDAAGSPALSERIPLFLRPRGTVVLLGLQAAAVPFDQNQTIFKELEVRGSRVYSPGDVDTALDHLGAGRISVRSLVTKIVGLEEVGDAFGTLEAGEAMKILVRLRG